MKLISYLQNGKERAGLLWDEKLFDTQLLSADLPDTMNKILSKWEKYYPLLLR